jgi:uncharacterized membrane protein
LHRFGAIDCKAKILTHVRVIGPSRTMSAMPATPPVNIFGRRAGRGLRPWLLLPKVLAVCCFFGGLASAFVLTFFLPAQAHDASQWRFLAHLIGWLFRFLVMPGSIAAGLLGLLLTLQAPRILLAQRWLQVKLLVLVLALPPLHLITRRWLIELQTYGQSGDLPSMGPPEIMPLVRWPIAAALLVVAVVVLLARVKPRLGQNWAHTYRRVKPASTTTPPGSA